MLKAAACQMSLRTAENITTLQLRPPVHKWATERQRYFGDSTDITDVFLDYEAAEANAPVPAATPTPSTSLTVAIKMVPAIFTKLYASTSVTATHISDINLMCT